MVPFVAARAISQIIISKGLIAARSTFVWLPLQLSGRPPTPTVSTPESSATLKSFTRGIKTLSESLYGEICGMPPTFYRLLGGKEGCLMELDRSHNLPSTNGFVVTSQLSGFTQGNTIIYLAILGCTNNNIFKGQIRWKEIQLLLKGKNEISFIFYLPLCCSILTYFLLQNSKGKIESCFLCSCPCLYIET